METKIKFQKSKSAFFPELYNEVQRILTPELMKESKKLMKIKLAVYATMYLTFYALLFTSFVYSNPYILLLTYCLLGLSGIVLAFNASHDATHGVLFEGKKLNAVVHYMIFNLQGVNATLWKKRHIHSHHIFPNVDGCDADIDDNPFIRLSQNYPLKKFHRYQHIYAPLIYCLYTLHWILIKDFQYLSKKSMANLRNLHYSLSYRLEVIALKVAYFFIMIGVPYLATDASLGMIILAFLCMHFFISIFFVLTLIISHLTLETEFPVANEKGHLPFDYHEHQLAVSMDYHPESKFCNWVFGGFNSHSAHHLFPNLQHTLYPILTPMIKKAAINHGLKYNELPMNKAIHSHFRYLKKLGRLQ